MPDTAQPEILSREAWAERLSSVVCDIASAFDAIQESRHKGCSGTWDRELHQALYELIANAREVEFEYYNREGKPESLTRDLIVQAIEGDFDTDGAVRMILNHDQAQRDKIAGLEALAGEDKLNLWARLKNAETQIANRTTQACRSCREEIAALRAEVERLKGERDEAQSLLASTTDLMNTCAREWSVPEARNESGIKQLFDRLWDEFSRKYFDKRDDEARAHEELFSIRAKLEAAEGDTKRLDWLYSIAEEGFGNVEICLPDDPARQPNLPGNLRAAIDAAMRSLEPAVVKQSLTTEPSGNPGELATAVDAQEGTE